CLSQPLYRLKTSIPKCRRYSVQHEAFTRDRLSNANDGLCKKNKHKLVRHDQTLINTVLHDEIGSLSFLYNYQLIDTTIPLLEEFQPKILHFVGELKPWNTEEGFIGSFHAAYELFVGQN